MVTTGSGGPAGPGDCTDTDMVELSASYQGIVPETSQLKYFYFILGDAETKQAFPARQFYLRAFLLSPSLKPKRVRYILLPGRLPG